MGARVYPDHRRFVSSVPVQGAGAWQYGGRVSPSAGLANRPSATPSITILYDGDTNKFGVPEALDAAECWIDPTHLLEPGTQLGITAMCTGASAVEVFGCMRPSDYALKVGQEGGALLVTECEVLWQKIADVPLDTAVQLVTDGKIYTLYMIGFDGVGPGSLVLTAR